ncbi:MAG TPA: PIN domain-containing protein [Candidatus Binataceae bacterium]|nr:PIN domain-containing protein [Candidatus Binataceae bacterium]
MIAVDSSSMIAFFAGESGADLAAVRSALALHQAVFPPVVVTELLSVSNIDDELARVVRSVPRLEILDGYWERAGDLRARLLNRGLKAALSDTLIAQSCIDHGVALVTRDRDFRNFVHIAGLRLQ